VHLKYS